MSKSISQIASDFGRMGGKALLKKRGKKYFKEMAIAREAKKKEQRPVHNTDKPIDTGIDN